LIVLPIIVGLALLSFEPKTRQALSDIQLGLKLENLDCTPATTVTKAFKGFAVKVVKYSTFSIGKATGFTHLRMISLLCWRLLCSQF
jgi:hypothetical protein